MLRRLKIIDLKGKEQKQPWFTEISPNGTIPALTDRSRGNFNVFESGAILLYLARHYDKEGKLSFNEQTEEKEYSEMVQWMFFVVSPSCVTSHPVVTLGVHYVIMDTDIEFLRSIALLGP